jgi:SAM-dependent MidA family methyltransferase
MNALALEIRREIQRGGPMTFARFMELALYAPALGYYERPGRIGRAGDFFTSVSTGPLFGQLLAFQFAEWLDSECPEGQVQVAEAGAHDGRLAADILDWLGRFRPDLMARLEYSLVESSPARRAWQEKTLGSWMSNLNWVPNIGDFGERRINGIVFSNEFFDALPVHRLAWDAKESRWREWRVAVAQDDFAWHLDVPAADLGGRLPPVPAELAKVLPDGFITEVSPVALDWWRTAALALRRGNLLTIDYGFSAENWMRPDRPGGALRAFARHHASADLLAQPGEQDLTADVNFFALEEAGRAAGMEAGILVRQSKFLTQILAKIHAKPKAFAAWDSKSARRFQTLAHPEHLGHPFQVLIQYRSIQSESEALPSSVDGRSLSRFKL